MYLNEQRLNDALLPSLAIALFGPERTGYWRHALDAAAEPERTAPAKERAAEIEAEITDLERRVGRQLVSLEADDVTAALRRRVGQRVAEMEDAVAERLYDRGSDKGEVAAQVGADDWSAPPAGAGPVLRQFVRLHRRLELA